VSSSDVVIFFPEIEDRNIEPFVFIIFAEPMVNSFSVEAGPKFSKVRFEVLTALELVMLFVLTEGLVIGSPEKFK
jgi:hypothetical protein